MQNISGHSTMWIICKHVTSKNNQVFIVIVSLMLICVTYKFLRLTDTYHRKFMFIRSKVDDVELVRYLQLNSSSHLTTNTSPQMHEPIDVGARRVNRVKEQCALLKTDQHYTPVKYSLIKHAYVVDKFRLIAELTPKTGRTTWQFVLWNNSLPGGSRLWQNQRVVKTTWQNPVLQQQGIVLLKNSQRNKTELDSYYKLLTVRHPLSRLESVYLNKLVNNTYYQKNWGVKILRLFRHKSRTNPRDFSTGKGVTFEEFIKFVIRSPSYDGHFQPFSDSAHPCVITYDFIAKTETANEDMDHIIGTRLAGKGRSLRMNWGRSHRTDRTEHGVLLRLFSGLPDLAGYVRQLMRVYGDDMRLFGYSYKLVDGKLYALCDVYTQHGKCV